MHTRKSNENFIAIIVQRKKQRDYKLCLNDVIQQVYTSRSENSRGKRLGSPWNFSSWHFSSPPVSRSGRVVWLHLTRKNNGDEPTLGCLSARTTAKLRRRRPSLVWPARRGSLFFNRGNCLRRYDGFKWDFTSVHRSSGKADFLCFGPEIIPLRHTGYREYGMNIETLFAFPCISCSRSFEYFNVVIWLMPVRLPVSGNLFYTIIAKTCGNGETKNFSINWIKTNLIQI